MTLIFLIAYYLLSLLIYLLIAAELISWFPIDPRNKLVRGLHAVTDPILHPIRSLIPPIGGISFDIMIAVFLLYLIRGVIAHALGS